MRPGLKKTDDDNNKRALKEGEEKVKEWESEEGSKSGGIFFSDLALLCSLACP